MKRRFFKCEHCGNIVTFMKDQGVPVVCCGQPMTELLPNTTDAAGEKHVPVYAVESGRVRVSVGEVEHPMTAEHSIEWLALETRQGMQVRWLTPDAAPRAEFFIDPADEAATVYAYCNLHGLWKA